LTLFFLPLFYEFGNYRFVGGFGDGEGNEG